VLVCGMNGTTIEVTEHILYYVIRRCNLHILNNCFFTTLQFCKNIVLAGVGSLSLMDDHIVTEDDLNTNFLIPPDEGIYGGTS
jgi:molybdopterin/thiamine biosynthesis adenylyltransferase